MIINVTIDGVSVSLFLHIFIVCGTIAAVEDIAARKPITMVGVSILTLAKKSTLIYSIRQSLRGHVRIDYL